MSPSNFMFKHNKSTYAMNIAFGTMDTERRDGLDINAMTYFKYENELNLLCLKAELEYADNYGIIDRYIEDPFAICEVTLYVMKELKDGSIIVELPSKTEFFNHKFVVESVLIRDRKKDIITYRIQLVSMHIYKCLLNIKYTNYNSDAESIFDIYKSCAQLVNMTIDPKTFELVVSDVRLNYITLSNDNLFSVTKYLLNKMFYYADKDDSLKFLMFNETKEQLQLFDIKNKETYNGAFGVMLSFMNGEKENIANGVAQQIANVVKFPNSSVVLTLFEKNATEYDFMTNEFYDVKTDVDTILNFTNNTFDDNKQLKKNVYKLNTDVPHTIFGTYWNNDYTTYDRFVLSITENNALVVHTTANILRKPGSVNAVVLDKTVEEANDNDTHTVMKNLRLRYKGISGTWFISKIVHIIEPNKLQYNQVLTLMRNFVPNFKVDDID